MWESETRFDTYTFGFPEQNKSIWCLFSVDNNYDQPDNNLVSFWFNKLSFNQLTKALGWAPLEKLDDEGILYVVNLWKGENKQVRPGDTAYRLQEVNEGEILEESY